MVYEGFKSTYFAFCFFKWLWHRLIFLIFIFFLYFLIAIKFIYFIQTILYFSNFSRQKFPIYFIFSLWFFDTFPGIISNLIFALNVSKNRKATPLTFHHNFLFFLAGFAWRGSFWPPAGFRISVFLFWINALSIHHSQKISIFVSQPFQL